MYCVFLSAMSWVTPIVTKLGHQVLLLMIWQGISQLFRSEAVLKTKSRSLVVLTLYYIIYSIKS